MVTPLIKEQSPALVYPYNLLNYMYGGVYDYGSVQDAKTRVQSQFAYIEKNRRGGSRIVKILKMRFEENKTFTEIAKAFNISTSSVGLILTTAEHLYHTYEMKSFIFPNEYPVVTKLTRRSDLATVNLATINGYNTLSTRVKFVLTRNAVHTVEDLYSLGMDGFLQLRGAGIKTLKEINKFLKQVGLHSLE